MGLFDSNIRGGPVKKTGRQLTEKGKDKQFLNWRRKREVMGYDRPTASGAINYSPIDPIDIFTGALAAKAVTGAKFLPALLDEVTFGARGLPGLAKAGYQKAKGLFNFAADLKPVKSVIAHKITNTGNVGRANVPVNIGNEKVIKSVPYNKETTKSLQQEYVEDLAQWYQSPQFKKIMKENHPDVDAQMYGDKTIQNLISKELLIDPTMVPEGAEGVFYPKRSSNAVYIHGHTPTFKQKVANANTLERIPGQDKRGRSYVKDEAGATYHELGHQRTNASELLPDQLTGDVLRKNYIGKDVKLSDSDFSSKDYATRPTEFETRAQQLRKDLKEKGIVDFHNEEITTAHIKKYFQGKDVREKNWSDLVSTEHELRSVKKAREINGATDYDVIGARKRADLALEKHEGSKLLSTDAMDLEDSYTPEFIANMMKILPSAGVAITTGAGLYNTNRK